MVYLGLRLPVILGGMPSIYGVISYNLASQLGPKVWGRIFFDTLRVQASGVRD